MEGGDSHRSEEKKERRKRVAERVGGDDNDEIRFVIEIIEQI
jgi:hypothetical protein